MEGRNDPFGTGRLGFFKGMLEALNLTFIKEVIVIRKFRHGGKVPSPGAADGRVLFDDAAIMEKLEAALKGLFHLAHAGPPIIVVPLEDDLLSWKCGKHGKIFFDGIG